MAERPPTLQNQTRLPEPPAPAAQPRKSSERDVTFHPQQAQEKQALPRLSISLSRGLPALSQVPSTLSSFSSALSSQITKTLSRSTTIYPFLSNSTTLTNSPTSTTAYAEKNLGFQTEDEKYGQQVGFPRRQRPSVAQVPVSLKSKSSTRTPTDPSSRRKPGYVQDVAWEHNLPLRLGMLFLWAGFQAMALATGIVVGVEIGNASDNGVEINTSSLEKVGALILNGDGDGTRESQVPFRGKATDIIAAVWSLIALEVLGAFVGAIFILMILLRFPELETRLVFIFRTVTFFLVSVFQLAALIVLTIFTATREASVSSPAFFAASQAEIKHTLSLLGATTTYRAFTPLIVFVSLSWVGWLLGVCCGALVISTSSFARRAHARPSYRYSNERTRPKAEPVSPIAGLSEPVTRQRAVSDPIMLDFGGQPRPLTKLPARPSTGGSSSETGWTAMNTRSSDGMATKSSEAIMQRSSAEVVEKMKSSDGSSKTTHSSSWESSKRRLAFGSPDFDPAAPHFPPMPRGGGGSSFGEPRPPSLEIEEELLDEELARSSMDRRERERSRTSSDNSAPFRTVVMTRDEWERELKKIGAAAMARGVEADAEAEKKNRSRTSSVSSWASSRPSSTASISRPNSAASQSKPGEGEWELAAPSTPSKPSSAPEHQASPAAGPSASAPHMLAPVPTTPSQQQLALPPSPSSSPPGKRAPSDASDTSSSPPVPEPAQAPIQHPQPQPLVQHPMWEAGTIPTQRSRELHRISEGFEGEEEEEEEEDPDAIEELAPEE